MPGRLPPAPRPSIPNLLAIAFALDAGLDGQVRRCRDCRSWWTLRGGSDGGRDAWRGNPAIVAKDGDDALTLNATRGRCKEDAAEYLDTPELVELL